jgi:hypothetical protein
MKCFRSSVFALLCLVACKTDKPKEPDAGAIDAGVTVVDAGAASDAGIASDAGVADAGEMQADAGIKITSTDTGNGGEKPKTPAPGVHDRILARPKNQDFNVDELRKQVETKTGLKITQARKSAKTWIFFQFAATPKGRDANDQKELIKKLEATGLFDAVEGDRLMKIKTK